MRWLESDVLNCFSFTSVSILPILPERRKGFSVDDNDPPL